MNKMETTAKDALLNLLHKLEPEIRKHLEELDSATLDYILQNYQQYLRLNLESYVRDARAKSGAADFDDLFGN